MAKKIGKRRLVHNSCFDEIAKHVADRFPGKSHDRIVGFLRHMAASTKPIRVAKDSATIWQRGKEILISRPMSTGLNQGTYFVKESLRDAKRYVLDFINDNGGQIF
jgi:hypothetical protein